MGFLSIGIWLVVCFRPLVERPQKSTSKFPPRTVSSYLVLYVCLRLKCELRREGVWGCGWRKEGTGRMKKDGMKGKGGGEKNRPVNIISSWISAMNFSCFCDDFSFRALVWVEYANCLNVICQWYLFFVLGKQTVFYLT